MNKLLSFVALCFLFHAGFSQTALEKDFSPIFQKYGVDGCFVLYNQNDNEFIRYNSGLCDSGYLPASTFKIPNSLIALEKGVIKDTNQVIKWDGHVWPNASWNRDQTLKSAMKFSCVWAYVGFAEQIDIQTYQEYVNAFGYGNKNLTGPPTRFWLAGLFRISANQQIDFLRKFYNYGLPGISQQSVDIVKDLIVLEKDQYTFSGKTGGGVLGDSEYIMWLVGYVEKDSKVYFYAMNFKATDFDRLAPARLAITRDVLKELGIL